MIVIIDQYGSDSQWALFFKNHFSLCVSSITKVMYSKTCLKQLLKNRQNKGLKDKW